jgi:uncharacterized LabA/DUF88 family protein
VIGNSLSRLLVFVDAQVHFIVKEKGVDASMIADIMTDLYELAEQGDIFILITGDADYVPVVEKLKAKNFAVHVLFWEHAAVTLKQAADQFKSLNGYLEQIRY